MAMGVHTTFYNDQIFINRKNERKDKLTLYGCTLSDRGICLCLGGVFGLVHTTFYNYQIFINRKGERKPESFRLEIESILFMA